MEALDLIQQNVNVVASFSRPMFESLLTVLLDCIDHASDSLRFRSACCLKLVVDIGFSNADAGRIVGAARGRFNADNREPCEELRTILIETIVAILNLTEAPAVTRSTGFAEDVVFCLEQGLLDDYSPVQIAATQCLEVFIKIGTNLPEARIKQLFHALQLCCKSKHWRVRHAVIKCMQKCRVQYPDITWEVLDPVFEKLVCDQSHQVRLCTVPLCSIDPTKPRIQSLYYAIILCFDDSRDIVSSALSVLLIDPSPSVLSDHEIRANAIAASACLTLHAQSLLHKMMVNFGSLSLNNTSKKLSLRLIPVLVLLFKDDSLALRDLVQIMLTEPKDEYIQLACRCAPPACLLAVIKDLLSDDSTGKHDLLILIQEIVKSHNFCYEPSLLLVEILDIVVLSDNLNSTIAETVISISKLVAFNRDRIDSVLIRLVAYCPDHFSLHSIAKESFNRELDRLVRTSLTPSDRKVLLQLMPRVDALPTRIYSLVAEYTKSPDIVTRMDGLELLYMLCAKFGNDCAEFYLNFSDGIESNLRWAPGQANNKVRKISLFVLHELMVRTACGVTRNLVQLLKSCIDDSWSPDNRFLSLKIFALVFEQGRGYEGFEQDIIEHVLERFEDVHEEIRSLAFLVIERMDLSRIDCVVVSRISDLLRVHAQVSSTAHTILKKLLY